MGNARSAIDHPVAIEVSSGANLHYHPDLMTQIPFDVKNNLYGPLNVLFGAKLNDVPQKILPQRQKFFLNS